MYALRAVFLWLFLGLKVFSVYFAAVALFTLRRRRRFPAAPPSTRFAVIAAARNEEAVIANLVASVRGQDYPAELVDIYVVPNNCTDRTGETALAAGAKLIRCRGTVRGKGDALHQAIARLLPRGYDAFLVLDADNTLAPGYLARMNDAFAAGAVVCKSRMRTANPRAGAVAGCYGLYNACFDLIWNRPRAACGLSAKLVGTGFAVRREVLEALGGWNTEAIAEDAEFAAQLAGAGIRVTWVPDAVNYDEAPTGFLTSLRQRRRWCSGVMQAARLRLGGLWQKGARGRFPLRLDMTMFLLTPFAQALSGLLLLAGALLSVLSGDGAGLLSGLGGLALSWIGGLLLGALLSLAGGYGLRHMGRAILLFPLFTASWMPLQVISLFRDTRTWQVIPHLGTACPAAKAA